MIQNGVETVTVTVVEGIMIGLGMMIALTAAFVSLIPIMWISTNLIGPMLGNGSLASLARLTLLFLWFGVVVSIAIPSENIESEGDQ